MGAEYDIPTLLLNFVGSQLGHSNETVEKVQICIFVNFYADGWNADGCRNVTVLLIRADLYIFDSSRKKAEPILTLPYY
jgi:hypothetical protein